MALFMLFGVVQIIPAVQVHAISRGTGFYFGARGHDVSNVPSSWFDSLPTDNFVGKGGTEIKDITNRNVVVVFGFSGSACTTSYLKAVIDVKRNNPSRPFSIIFYDQNTLADAQKASGIAWNELSGYVGGYSSCKTLLDNCKGEKLQEYPVVAYLHDKRIIDVTYGIVIGLDVDGALYSMNGYNNTLPFEPDPEPIPAATSTSKCVLSNSETPFTISGIGEFLVVANPPMRSRDSMVQIAFNTSAKNEVAKSSKTSVLDSTSRVAYNLSKFKDGTYYLQLKSKNGKSENTIYSGTQFPVIITNGVATFPASVVDYNNQQLSNTQGDSQEILDYWKKGSDSPSNNWINSTDSTIVKQADKITSKCTTDYSKILAIHDWVSANIYYDKDYYNKKATGYDDSVNVLKYKRAVCQGYADLTVALLRAVGIPAKVVSGYAGASPTLKKLSNHAWTLAYCQSQNRWITLDTTWDSRNKYSNGKFSKPQPIGSVYFDPTLQKFSLDHRIDSIGFIDGERDPDAFLKIPDYPLNVSFSVDGTIIEKIRTGFNYIINAPTDPIKPNYIFDGWYTSESGGQQVYFQYKVKRSVTLYARWRPATIIFNTNGGDVISPTAYYNVKQGDIKDPVRAGYTFAGWYTTSKLTTAWDFNTDNVTKDITLYAKWTATH